MSKHDVAYYLADTKGKKELEFDKKDREEKEEYDTDMNRVMFNEFWGDLSDFKPKKSLKKKA